MHLRVGDLRKSAITEMVSAGVDTSAIMSVSGHKSIQSLNPYLKHTLGAATSALDMRRNK
jgi:integrase